MTVCGTLQRKHKYTKQCTREWILKYYNAGWPRQNLYKNIFLFLRDPQHLGRKTVILRAEQLSELKITNRWRWLKSSQPKMELGWPDTYAVYQANCGQKPPWSGFHPTQTVTWKVHKKMVRRARCSFEMLARSSVGSVRFNAVVSWNKGLKAFALQWDNLTNERWNDVYLHLALCIPFTTFQGIYTSLKNNFKLLIHYRFVFFNRWKFLTTKIFYIYLGPDECTNVPNQENKLGGAVIRNDNQELSSTDVIFILVKQLRQYTHNFWRLFFIFSK